MTRDFKIIAAIADVHIGNKAISWKEYKKELQKAVIDKLNQIRFLDGVVLCGDTLHYQISLNSEYANVFQWFISEIVRIAKKHNAFVRVIKGTRSHDLEQLETIRQYEDFDDIDFKIITDYMIETIDGHNYAYIAENYIHDSVDDYYKEIFGKPYEYFDMIFGHGTIEQTQFTKQNSENFSSSAPIFSLNDFYKVCRGPIIFGHIHTPMNFNDKFFYVGSTLRTCHGEEEDKGWNIIAYIQSSGLYRVDKIVNEYALNFCTISLDDKYIRSNDADYIIKYIETYIDSNKIDKLSVKVVCIDDEESLVKIELLKKYFAKNTNISTSFKLLSEKSYQIEENININKELKPYLKDGLDIVERIQLWSMAKRNAKLEREDITRFITPKALEKREV